MTLFVLYFFCIMVLVYGFKRVGNFSSTEKGAAIGFSVVIPFRNEAENLADLLRTIANLNYPSELFEIIFVDDASEDNSEAFLSEAIVKSKFSIRLIQNKRLSNSPKKDAISEAIKSAKYEWIVTTDADCKLPQDWLKTLGFFIQANHPVMVCGPVKYESDGRFIENFQQLDGLSLQAVSIGSFGFKNPLLSNGANLAYSKSAFLSVNGFAGNDHIASGDDIFLLEKVKKAFPGQVQFLKSKDAIVSTKPQKDWMSLLNQRIRWASKTSEQKNTVSLFLGLVVFLVAISILAFPFLMVFDAENLEFYLLLIIFKIIIDFILIRQAVGVFNVKIQFWRFLLQTFVYAGVVFVVVLGSLRGKYVWKGRHFEKP